MPPAHGGKGVAMNEKEATEARKQFLEKARQKMKELKISYRSAAFQMGCSPSWVGVVMRGGYPFYGAFGWPRYFDDFFSAFLGLSYC